jgi:hypothetical protein
LEKASSEDTATNKKMLEAINKQLIAQEKLVESGKNAISKEDLVRLREGMGTAGSFVGARKQTDEDIRKQTAIHPFTYGIGKFGREMMSGEGSIKDRFMGQMGKAGDALTGGEGMSMKGMMNVLGKALPAALIGAGGLLESPAMMIGGAFALDKQKQKEELIRGQKEEAAASEGEMQQAILRQSLSPLNEEVAEEAERINREEGAAPGKGPVSMNYDSDSSELLYLKLDDIFGVNKEIRDIAQSQADSIISFNDFQRDMLMDASLARDEQTEAAEETTEVQGEKEEEKDMSFMDKIMKHGTEAAIAAAAGIGVAVGETINMGMEKLWGPGGLGGKLHDWINGDVATGTEARTQLEETTKLGAEGTKEEIQQEKEKIQKQIEALEVEKKKDESAFFGLGGKFEAGMDEQAQIGELQTQMRILDRKLKERENEANSPEATKSTIDETVQKSLVAYDNSTTKQMTDAEIAIQKKKEEEAKEPVVVQNAPTPEPTPQAPAKPELSSGDMNHANALFQTYPIGS